MRTTVTVSVLSVLVGAALSGCGLVGGSPSPGSTPPPPAAPLAPPASVPSPVSMVGLVGGTSLVNLSTTDLGPRESRTITGLDGDKRLIGIDYRVQDGELYGVGEAGGVYTIDDGGAATKVRQLSVKLDGQNFGVDFNPAANALRVISDTGQNLRQPFADAAAKTTADKALTNPATPPATDPVPAQGASSAGYTNNDTDQATGTALFVLDTKADRLSIQSPANAGTFAPMGGLGVDATKAGFDIYSPAGAPAADVAGLATLQVGGKWGLYRVDLLSGKATSMGELTDDVTDIAIPLTQS